jgi:hypothetical protein
MAGIELAYLEAAPIAGEVSAQVAIEGRHVETVTFHDRDGLGISRHAGREYGACRETQFGKD